MLRVSESADCQNSASGFKLKSVNSERSVEENMSSYVEINSSMFSIWIFLTNSVAFMWLSLIYNITD